MSNGNEKLRKKTLLPIRLVFSNKIYVAIAAGVSVSFWIILNVLDQLLFFSPLLTFYLPSDATVGFIISTIIAILSGIVVSLNIFLAKHSKIKHSASLFSGSSLGVISTACAGCSSLSFVLISTFGGVGIATSTFLSIYQTPLRILSIGLLALAYYSINKKLAASCNMDKISSNTTQS